MRRVLTTPLGKTLAPDGAEFDEQRLVGMSRGDGYWGRKGRGPLRLQAL